MFKTAIVDPAIDCVAASTIGVAFLELGGAAVMNLCTGAQTSLGLEPLPQRPPKEIACGATTNIRASSLLARFPLILIR